MGFRFRRSINILPGIRLNIGKRGVSTSIGGRGATVNFSRRGTRTTLSLPGTGLSYTTTSPRKTAAKAHSEAPAPTAPEVYPPGKAWRGWLWFALITFAITVFIRDALK